MSGDGFYFYIVAIAPDLRPERVKFGVAKDVEKRFAAHRCSSPTAQLVAFWPCHRKGEAEAIRVGALGGAHVGGEVHDIDSETAAIARLSQHFDASPMCLDAPVLRERHRKVEVGMEFRDAMEILAGPPMGGEVAMAAGVSLNTISRARREVDAHYRTPPKNWKAVVRRLALERVAALSALASELADA